MNLTKLNNSWKTIKVYNQLDGISEQDILMAIQQAKPTTVATYTSKLSLQMSVVVILILQVVCCQGM